MTIEKQLIKINYETGIIHILIDVNSKEYFYYFDFIIHKSDKEGCIGIQFLEQLQEKEVIQGNDENIILDDKFDYFDYNIFAKFSSREQIEIICIPKSFIENKFTTEYGC